MSARGGGVKGWGPMVGDSIGTCHSMYCRKIMRSGVGDFAYAKVRLSDS